MMKLLKLLVATITSLALLGTAAHAQGTFLGTNPLVLQTGVPPTLTEALRIDAATPFAQATMGGAGSQDLFSMNWSGHNTQFEIMSNNASGGAQAGFISYNTSATSPGGLYIGKVNNTTIGGQGAVANNTVVGQITFFGSDGNKFVDTARIEAWSDNGYSNNFGPGRLTFLTNPGGSGATTREAMRIDSAQRVILGGVASIGAVYSDVGTLQVNAGVNESIITSTAWETGCCGSAFHMQKSHNSTIGSHGLVGNNEQIGYQTYAGSDGTQFLPVVEVDGFVDGATSAGHMFGRYVIQTSGGGTSVIERLRIDSAGTVNIGNQGAAFANVFSDTLGLQVTATGGSIDIRRYSNNNSSTYISTAKSRGTTIGSNVTVQTGDKLFEIWPSGFDATGTPVLRTTAVVSFQVDAAPTAGSVPGLISFGTSPSGNAFPTEAIRIDSNQNVNIGNQGSTLNDVFGTAPRLQVSGTGTSANLNLRRYSADANAAQVSFVKSRNASLGSNSAVSSGDTLGYITFDGFDTNPTLRESVSIHAEADAAPTANSVAGRLSFGTNASGTNGNPTERMRIDSKGHISYTTPAPTASACAGFALGTGSSDTSGRVTFTSATSCAISFGTAFTNAPFCTVSPGSAASTVTITTSTTVLTATFGTANTAMFYQCYGS